MCPNSHRACSAGSLTVSRRQFLRRSAAAAGAIGLPAIVPASVLAAAGATAPSNRVVLGCIGLGIQGMGNMRTFRGNPEVQVVAVCDVHETQRQQAKQSVDEFYDNRDCAALQGFPRIDRTAKTSTPCRSPRPTIGIR